MLAGVDQAAPSQRTAFPAESTAMQKADDTHDTEVKEPLGSMLTGADHADPSQRTALPW